jgi:hypothetical protein
MRGIPQGKIEKVRLTEQCLGMGERGKPEPPMIFAVPAISYASEGQAVGNELGNRVIYNNRSTANAIQPLIMTIGISRKDVSHQRGATG